MRNDEGVCNECFVGADRQHHPSCTQYEEDSFYTHKPGEPIPYRSHVCTRECREDAHIAAPLHDPVNHPKHYTSHPSGIECIQITEHMSFNIGNAIKYLWRADEKGAPIEDLEKARWYLDREIKKRKANESKL